MPLIAISAGSLSVSADGSALGSLACTEVLVQADPDNTPVVFVGPATAQPFVLVPGATLTLRLSNLSALWARTSAASATVNWLARSGGPNA
jgi:hypothetical protein